EPGLHIPERVEIHQYLLADRLRNARYGRSAGNDRKQIVPAPAHAPCMTLDQLPQRDAHLLLDVARLVYVPGDAENFRARILRSTNPKPPVDAAPEDRGHDGNGFNIIHRRRTAI